MDRRKFIKIAGLGVGAVALSSTLVHLNSADIPQQLGWTPVTGNEKDIRLKLLSYAILSANPHNTQAWIIQMTGPLSFDLYVDPERLLPETDPYYRQIHIGQGSFLETLSIAASGFQYQANIDYFPQGMYGNQALLNKPVASINLVKQQTKKTDPLFSQLLLRHSNKRNYSNQGLNQAEKTAIQEFHGRNNEFPLTIVDSTQAKAHMAKILPQSMAVEITDRAREMETIHMFRFNDNEVKKYRDGFGIAQSGKTGIKKLIVENLFLSRQATEKDPSAFGLEALNMTQTAADTTNTFAWISSATNTRLDQVKVGRSYCRMNLQTSAMGLAQHPMSQVLQEYPAMLPLQADFKKAFAIEENDTIQMLFRLGHAAPTMHSPRRLVSAFIRSE